MMRVASSVAAFDAVSFGDLTLVAYSLDAAATQRAGDTMSEIAAPVCIGGRVLGVLDAISTQPDAFTSQDLELLSAIADTLALAIAYAELSQRQSG